MFEVALLSTAGMWATYVLTKLWGNLKPVEEKNICLCCLLMAVSALVSKTRYTSQRESKLISMAQTELECRLQHPKIPRAWAHICSQHVLAVSGWHRLCRLPVSQLLMGRPQGLTCVLCSQPAASLCHPRRDHTLDFGSTAKWNHWKALVSSTQLGLIPMCGKSVVFCCWGGKWEEKKLIGDVQRIGV